MKVLYLHGFNSAGFGSKVDKLRDIFGAENVINPTYPPDTEKAVKLLQYLAEKIKDDGGILVGSSQGGFYSMYISYHTGIPAVLINPQTRSYDPQQESSIIIKNFKTNEEYEYKREYSEYLRNLELNDSQIAEIKDRLYVYVDLDDDVIDGKTTYEFFRKRDVYVKGFPGGDHYFQHLVEFGEDIGRIFS